MAGAAAAVLWFAADIFLLTAGVCPLCWAILAAVPSVLLAFAQAPQVGLYIILLYVGIQQFESDLLTPIIREKAVDLPPVLTLVATFVAGLLVATPLAAVVLVRMLYREDVLGDEVALPRPFAISSPDAAKSATRTANPPASRPGYLRKVPGASTAVERPARLS